MTLEDFFTLTEMKDGLTALSRVNELVAVMQKEKDCVVKNIGDATRQWTAVASTIAATDNKDCLDHFIQLDGLWFIDRWLKDAQKFVNDTNDSFVEESITALLRALEKLQIDKERSISSGIWITVNGLLDHKSSQVQDRARALFDRWKLGKVSDTIGQDVQSAVGLQDVSMVPGENSVVESAAGDIPLSKNSAHAETNASESANEETLPLISTNSLQKELAEDFHVQNNNNELSSNLVLEQGTMEDRSSASLNTSVVPHSVPESPSAKEKSLMGYVEGTSSTETHGCPVPNGSNAEAGSDAPEKLISHDKPGETASASTEAEPGAISPVADGVSAQEIVVESGLEQDVKPKEDVQETPGRKDGTDDGDKFNHFNASALETVSKDDDCPDDVQGLSGKENRLVNSEDLRASFSMMEDVETAYDGEHSSDADRDSGDDSHLSKSPIHSRSPDRSNRRSVIELEYGIDALEVARQVAQEVEREVDGYRERSYSSSEKIIDSAMRLGSPDSINENKNPTAGSQPEDVGQNHSPEACPEEGEGPLGGSGNLDTEMENGTPELESSQVTEVAQEPEVNTEKSQCVFDLNQEVSSDDIDRPVNLPNSTPISFVSASRPATTSGSPKAPLHFEGTLGWKGSAATSAFRPASPLKVSDGEKTLETGGASSSSRHRQGCLDIDLNVAEDIDDKVAEVMSGRQNLTSSGVQSGESSFDAGSRRSERPSLDLNRISDDSEAPPSDLRMETQFFPRRNGQSSQSPASSSSSMQPSMRNFDLNDRPLFLNDFSDQGLHGKATQNSSSYIGSKPGDPVISIMGTRVEVGRKDLFLQNPSLLNGKPLEPVMDANAARMGGVLEMVPAVSYTHSPIFGHNGLTTAPAMSLSSAMYGPGCSITYMVDSRGAPVVPQIVGSASAVPPYSQQPFIMSMAGVPLGLNGPGPSRPSFDLNSGFAIDGGSSGLRQHFMPGQSRSLEEHFRAAPQPSTSSGVSGKRKEPDGGWDPYSLQYKHLQPPWR